MMLNAHGVVHVKTIIPNGMLNSRRLKVHMLKTMHANITSWLGDKLSLPTPWLRCVHGNCPRYYQCLPIWVWMRLVWSSPAWTATRPCLALRRFGSSTILPRARDGGIIGLAKPNRDIGSPIGEMQSLLLISGSVQTGTDGG